MESYCYILYATEQQTMLCTFNETHLLDVKEASGEETVDPCKTPSFKKEVWTKDRSNGGSTTSCQSLNKPALKSGYSVADWMNRRTSVVKNWFPYSSTYEFQEVVQLSLDTTYVERDVLVKSMQQVIQLKIELFVMMEPTSFCFRIKITHI